MTAPSIPLVAADARARALASRALAAAALVFWLDGIYVMAVFAGVLGATTPERIFQGIAGALLGPAAFDGGWQTALLGVAMHFLVSLGWTALWLAAYERSERLRAFVAGAGRAVLAGVLYGALVHLLMQRVVLPMTDAPALPLLAPGALLVLLAHVTVIGPPIVLLTRRR